MSNILVTGSNGFIGKNIVARLREDGYIIGTGRRGKACSSCNKYIRWDMGAESEPDELKDLKIQYVVHAAASLARHNLSDCLIGTNCYGTFNILKLAVEHKAKCIIYISSLPVIGNRHMTPIVENLPLNPPSLYHATKAAGELIIGQAINYGIHSVSLRVPSPIGPEMPLGTIVPVFIQKAMHHDEIILQGKGTRKQNYIDVRDIAEAVYRILQKTDMDGIFNLGSSNILSNIELAYKCIDVLKSKSKIKYSGMVDPDDNVDWTTDDSKIREKIGEYQNYSMEDSIVDIAKAIK